ncbi:zinc finger protein OZF-like [Anopheles ziemanni]|uniref:zinc finger protein OZF-like n=1 Tax=Anopheles ziemanni TaxID=345580 RepID=UPI00265EA2F6|nr:zinc finger protein OZF-like [Anopheles ziemanni]
MEHLCRVCLESNNPKDDKLVELFRSYVHGVAIGTLLHELFCIEIAEDDNLPQSICQRCFMELQVVFGFKDKLLISDATLRKRCSAKASSKNEDHLQDETVISCSATTSSEMMDHEEEENDNADKSVYTDEVVLSASVEMQQGLNEGQPSIGSKSQRFCCVTHCKEAFRHESELLKHAQDVHSLKLRWNRERQEAGKPFKCNICERAFNSAKNLRIHQFVRVNQDCKLHTCKDCPFRAVSNALLIIHERSHTGERPFGCSQCPKRFNSELNLKNHQICHKTERSFVCSYCSKQFARKRNMEEHIRSCHSDEKPYHCDVCSAQFKVQQHLRLHRRLHTGEKPYKCSYCANSFYHISDRKRHEMSHTGEKPYSCKTCGMSYTRKRTLIIHERTHTGERPFCCNDCGKTFHQASLLKRHTIRHHSSTCPDTFSCDPSVNESQQASMNTEKTFIIEGVYSMHNV